MQAEISSTFVDSETPEQSVALTRKINKIKADTEKIVEESYELDSKISMEIVKLSSDEKQKIELSSLETKMKSLKISVDDIQQKCDKYLDATSVKPVNSADPVRTVHTSPANDRLERLPFPRFSGKRVDWLFFKQMFLTHVIYPEEAKRVLALKEKCLNKREKELISKETTLAGCWKKLDAEFGGEASLAREVINQMRTLKTPNSDKLMITFVDSVQNGVSSLRSITNGETYLPTLCLIIEEKLEEELQRAY